MECTTIFTNTYQNTLFAVYTKGKYIHNKYYTEIRSDYGVKDARKFLMNKFSLSALSCDEIKWEIQAKFISNQSYSKQKTIKKFIFYWLDLGNKELRATFYVPALSSFRQHFCDTR